MRGAPNEMAGRHGMTQAKVTFNVRKVSDASSVVDIEGEVNAFAENALMDAYTLASTGGCRAIILNFSDLEYMNSGGIGLLVTLLIRVQRQGQRLMAIGLSDHYLEVFEITRLADFMSIFPDEESALAGATPKKEA